MTAPLSAALIRHGRLEENHWQRFVPDAGGPALPPDEQGWILPFTVWQDARDAVAARHYPVALLLAPETDCTALAELPTNLAFIAIDFPSYTDGRGYSLAQLLRHQYHWSGELRAMGDVMIDTIHYQARVGFDSFLVKAGHDPHAALAALHTFSVHYQKTYPAPSLHACQ